MTLLNTEVAVVGGGMVGGALALGLAQQGFDVTVIEQAAPPAFDPASQPDVRISAISAASVDLLRGLGVWEAVLAMRAHPYSRLETWEWENAHVSFDAAGETAAPGLYGGKQRAPAGTLAGAGGAPEGDAARSGLAESPASS